MRAMGYFFSSSFAFQSSRFASGGNCFSSVDEKDRISNISKFGCKT